jgi:hypothetical protein
MSDDELVERSARAWRPVIIWAAVVVALSTAVALLALVWAMQVTGQRQATVEATRQENLELRAQVAANTKQAECRARISSAAEAIRSERDSIGWQALVDRFVAGKSEGLVDRTNEIAGLNEQLHHASDLRSQAIEVCSANPDFVPPDPIIPAPPGAAHK